MVLDEDSTKGFREGVRQHPLRGTVANFNGLVLHGFAQVDPLMSMCFVRAFWLRDRGDSTSVIAPLLLQWIMMGCLVGV